MLYDQADELAMQVAKRITSLRLQKTWTREILSKRSGVNVHTLKHFERTGQISLQRLISICKALDIVNELERLFKPRHRVNIENWQVDIGPTRHRGKSIEEISELEPV